MANLWLRERAQTWEKNREVPGDDLAYVCTEVIPALVRGTKGTRFVGLAIHYEGAGGIKWTRELIKWNFDEVPEPGQLLLITEQAKRECVRVAARYHVKTLHLAVLDRPQAGPEDRDCECHECRRKHAARERDRS